MPRLLWTFVCRRECLFHLKIQGLKNLLAWRSNTFDASRGVADFQKDFLPIRAWPAQSQLSQGLSSQRLSDPRPHACLKRDPSAVHTATHAGTVFEWLIQVRRTCGLAFLHKGPVLGKDSLYAVYMPQLLKLFFDIKAVLGCTLPGARLGFKLTLHTRLPKQEHHWSYKQDYLWVKLLHQERLLEQPVADQSAHSFHLPSDYAYVAHLICMSSQKSVECCEYSNAVARACLNGGIADCNEKVRTARCRGWPVAAPSYVAQENTTAVVVQVSCGTMAKS